MMDFKTVYKEAKAEVIEKKSRFIASVKPVNTAGEAEAFINTIKKEHYKATHNVFAYCIGSRSEIERQSDDGEPSGTAGLPVLEVLRKMGLTNLAVVVTRYYGGILLGAGGLIRAYGNAAREGVLAAGILEKRLYQQIYIKADYSLLGKLQYEINTHGEMIQDIIYQEDIEIIALVRPGNSETFVKHITELSHAASDIRIGGTIFTEWLDGKIHAL